MLLKDLSHYTQGFAISNLMGVEGDYADIKEDRGGKTRYGITERTAIKHKKLWAKYNWNGHMPTLPQGLAFEIYVLDYWDPLLLDDIMSIHPLLADKLLDIGVNQGIGVAGRFLQRILNVFNKKATFYEDLKVDGILGSKTLKALNAFVKQRGQDGIFNIIINLHSLQLVNYLNIADSDESQETFSYGWSNRVKDALINYHRFFVTDK